VLDGIRHGNVQGGIFRPTVVASRDDRDGRGRERRRLHRLDNVLLGHLHLLLMWHLHLLLRHLHLHLLWHHHVVLHLLRGYWQRSLLWWHRWLLLLLSNNRRSLLWDLLLLGRGTR